MSTKTKVATKSKNQKDYENEVVIPVQSLNKLIGVKAEDGTIGGFTVNIGKTKNGAVVKFTSGKTASLSSVLGANVILTDSREQDNPAAVSPDDDFDTPEDDEDDE